MIKASNPELQLHFSVLESKKNSFSLLTNHYSEHLLACLSKWYGNILNDPSLAYEAVYESLRYYCEHPRKFNPEYGCLARFLELCADRTMQQILERENYVIHLHSIDRFLAKHFDNERDVLLAKLIMKNKADFPSFVYLLDIGSYRIGQQLSEIRRHTARITRTLEANAKPQTTGKRRVMKQKLSLAS